MDLTSGVYFKLNSTASFFFSILEQPTSYLSALAQMQDHFDVDSEVLKMDCDVLANELLEKGLIVIES